MYAERLVYGRCRTYPTPSEFTQHLQDLSNTFRIYPTPSEFTQHLQNLSNTFRFYQPLQDLSNTFRIYPTPSEFTQHLQNFPNLFRCFPTFSDCFQHFQNSPTTFRKICFEASGPFWTFFLKFQDPKNVGFAKNDFLEENYELPGRP